MSYPINDRMSQLRNLLDSDPHDAFCMYGIAMEHAKTGAHEEAVAWFDRTMETDPAYCYAWFHKARSQESMGNQAGAIQTLEDGIEQAKSLGDQHAADEMGGFLQSIL
jgi:tetratricopeptide (TPR) repeat protein